MGYEDGRNDDMKRKTDQMPLGARTAAPLQQPTGLGTRTAVYAPTFGSVGGPLPARINASSPGNAALVAPALGKFSEPKVSVPPAGGAMAYGTRTATAGGYDTKTAIHQIPMAVGTQFHANQKYAQNDRAMRAMPSCVGAAPDWTPPTAPVGAGTAALPQASQVNTADAVKTAIIQLPLYANRIHQNPPKTAPQQQHVLPYNNQMNLTSPKTAMMAPQQPFPAYGNQMNLTSPKPAMIVPQQQMPAYGNQLNATSPKTAMMAPQPYQQPAYGECRTARLEVQKMNYYSGGPSTGSSTSADDYFSVRTAESRTPDQSPNVSPAPSPTTPSKGEEDVSFNENITGVSSTEASSRTSSATGSKEVAGKKIRSSREACDAERIQAHMLQTGIKGLADEFKMLPTKYTIEETKTFFANANKNRYKNVPCLECTRVKLLNRSNDYIHANYVRSVSNPKRFICTQGPLPATSADFWHMIAQEGVESILMLCDTVECGAKKCDEYFPTNKNKRKVYDDIAVELRKCIDASTLCDSKRLIISELKIKWPGGSRKIKHYRWLDWPDKGVPPISMTPFCLYQKIKNIKTPIVVHCSAGVGRTGTLVALFIILDHLEQGETCPNAFEVVKKLREQRYFAIQKVNQYVYLNRTLFDHFECKRRLSKEGDQSQAIQKFINDYEEFQAKNT